MIPDYQPVTAGTLKKAKFQNPLQVPKLLIINAFKVPGSSKHVKLLFSSVAWFCLNPNFGLL